MVVFDKAEIREALSIENIYELINEWGGDPEYTSFGIISTTICHNYPGEGSRKLYYYENSDLFKCYTACDESFDIFELTIKVADIQKGLEYDLNDAVRFIAQRFGLAGRYETEMEDELDDWKYLENYDRIQDISIETQEVILKPFDTDILTRFNYKIKLTPWLDEGITQEVLNKAFIGFYPGGDQITIPHFDIHSRFIGLRGRTLCEEEGKLYGKYRPIKVNNVIYNHPLGMNLYNLNNSKVNIPKLDKAIVFEGEKSCLLYRSYFGIENDITVACCGSSITNYQIQLLRDCGAKEIIIAFDRQFEELGDDDFKKLTKKLTNIHSKYKNYVNISFMFDKEKITGYKASPIDEGKEKFLKLFKERISL